MRNDTKAFLLKSFIIPLLGCIFICFTCSYKFAWVYLCYLFIITPAWIVFSNIKFLLKNNWKKTLCACLILCIVEYVSAISLPIGGAITGASGLKMVCQIVLFVGTIINFIMVLVIVGIKAFYIWFKKRKDRKMMPNDIEQL